MADYPRARCNWCGIGLSFGSQWQAGTGQTNTIRVSGGINELPEVFSMGGAGGSGGDTQFGGGEHYSFCSQEHQRAWRAKYWGEK